MRQPAGGRDRRVHDAVEVVVVREQHVPADIPGEASPVPKARRQPATPIGAFEQLKPVEAQLRKQDIALPQSMPGVPAGLIRVVNRALKKDVKETFEKNWLIVILNAIK